MAYLVDSLSQYHGLYYLCCQRIHIQLWGNHFIDSEIECYESNEESKTGIVFKIYNLAYK